MKREQLQALGLTEEQIDKFLATYPNLVPKSRLDDLINEKKELQSLLDDRDKQLKELEKSTKDNNEELNSQIKSLQEKNKASLEEYNNKMVQLKVDNAIELGLIQNGALNNKAVRALLELEKIKFENDKLVGFDEQIETLKGSEETAFLFTRKEEKQTFSGIEPTKTPDSNLNIPNNNGYMSFETFLNKNNY